MVVAHHVDADEPDAQGQCRYRYEYDVYCFSEGKVIPIARSYADTPDEAHLLSVEADGTRRLLRDADLNTPLFVQATAYLRRTGKNSLTWLSGRGNGYETLPPV